VQTRARIKSGERRFRVHTGIDTWGAKTKVKIKSRHELEYLLDMLLLNMSDSIYTNQAPMPECPNNYIDIYDGIAFR
jgi:hypothetical protein